MRKFGVQAVLLLTLLIGISASSSFAGGQVGVSITIAPPALPVYAQPVCPGDGYIWTPGYWAWDPNVGDYYWVPGTWVPAPQVGFFWTPGWWGWGNGFYVWHGGYWGPHVGFYGGINYGFGYFGTGYVGGRWDGGHFFYNREVTNVNVTVIHNVYNEHVDVREVNHVSFNGGHGGIEARPTAEEEAYDREHHEAPVAAQERHVEEARSNEQLRATYNHGKPPIAATARPGDFTEHEPAREAGGEYRPPAAATPRNPGTAVHARDLPEYNKPAAPNTGNPKLDQKYQKQQDKMAAQQQKERQQLEQRQEQEDQKLQQRNASQQRVQQQEQKHQQQTQQMYQRHTQQQQHLQSKQQPPQQHGGQKPR